MGASRSPQDIERLRVLYETQGLSTAEISAATGVPVKSIRRYANMREWRRGAASPPGSGELIGRLWAALEQRIACVEKDPGATPARDFVALARALRDIAALSADGRPVASAPAPAPTAGDEPDAEALRAELAARLERILAS